MPIISSERISADESGKLVFASSDATSQAHSQQASGATASGNVGQTGSVTVIGHNLGSGSGVFASSTGTNNFVLNFKSVIGGIGIRLVESAETITVIATGELSNSTFIDLVDGPGFVQNRSVLVGYNGNLAWSSQAVTPNTVLTYNGTSFAWSTLRGTINSSDVVAALGYTPVNPNLFGVSNGIATLDSTGRIRSSNLPLSISGAVVYQGVWNANTNIPNLQSSFGTKGYYYKVSVAGNTTLDGHSSWAIDDTVIFDGDVWDKIGGITVNASLDSNGKLLASQFPNTNVVSGTYNNSTLVIGSDGRITNAVSNKIILSGDIIGNGFSSITTSLSNTGVVAGTYGNPTLTVDQKGRITSISTGNISNGVSSTGANRYALTIAFDINGDVSNTNTFTNIPGGWSATRDNANQVTITHNLGLFPVTISTLSYNPTLSQWVMKVPNGNPTAQFSIGINSNTTTPNNFTIYGLSSTSTSGSVNGNMILNIMI